MNLPFGAEKQGRCLDTHCKNGYNISVMEGTVNFMER